MILSDDTFDPYARLHYRNECCMDINEFYDDLKRIRYIKVLIGRYKDTGSLQERLILNHLIAMGNMFDTEAVVKMLFYRLDENDYPIIKAFLKYLNFMPKIVYDIRGRDIWDDEIKEDIYVIQKLNEL